MRVRVRVHRLPDLRLDMGYLRSSAEAMALDDLLQAAIEGHPAHPE